MEPHFYLRKKGKSMSEQTNQLFTTKGLAKMAILGALAFILMLIEFPLPIAPFFYKMDVSEVAALLGGFALGPLAAVVIEGIKILLNILFTGSTTAYVGELASFITGCAFAVPAAIIYKRNKSKKSALIGMCIGTLCLVVVGALLNAYVLLPLFSSLYHMPMDELIAFGTAIFSSVKDIRTFVVFCVCPFNFIKGVLVSLITYILYKRVSPILHK